MHNKHISFTKFAQLKLLSYLCPNCWFSFLKRHLETDIKKHSGTDIKRHSETDIKNTLRN